MILDKRPTKTRYYVLSCSFYRISKAEQVEYRAYEHGKDSIENLRDQKTSRAGCQQGERGMAVL